MGLLVAGQPTQSGPLGANFIQPTSGTFGRVQSIPSLAIGGAPVIIATISSWSLPGDSAGVVTPNFESPIDALGRVWPIVLPGLSTGKINLEGQVNLDLAALTDGIITNGIYVMLDLLYSKVLQIGYNDVFGYVTNFKPGSKVENQFANFTCDIMTSGIVQVSAPIT